MLIKHLTLKIVKFLRRANWMWGSLFVRMGGASLFQAKARSVWCNISKLWIDSVLYMYVRKMKIRQIPIINRASMRRAGLSNSLCLHNCVLKPKISLKSAKLSPKTVVANILIWVWTFSWIFLCFTLKEFESINPKWNK